MHLLKSTISLLLTSSFAALILLLSLSITILAVVLSSLGLLIQYLLSKKPTKTHNKPSREDKKVRIIEGQYTVVDH